jgi:heat shock protein HtpX
MHLVGARPLIEGLKLIHGAVPVFNAYWSDEMAPMLRRGFHPPMAEGFRRYLAAPDIAEAVSTRLNRDLAHGEANPYDTHPPLQQRLEALQNWPQGEMPEQDPRSISLLRNIDVIEARLLGWISYETTAQGLKPVAWDEVDRKVWVTEWEGIMRKYGAALSGIAPQSLPELSQDLDALSRRFGIPDGDDFAPEKCRQQALTMLGIALSMQ